jgi:hypothetical protein
LLLLALAGCGGADDRLVKLSQRSLASQAEQNQQMAQQSTEVAKATRQLVEADAQARQELITAQTRLESQLYAERTSLDRQQEALENERKGLAAQRGIGSRSWRRPWCKPPLYWPVCCRSCCVSSS